MASKLTLLLRVVALVSVVATLALPLESAHAAVPSAPDPRYFAETGFRISDDAFWDYFQKRGGVRNFGYPVSRKFQFMGTQVQFFQRRVLQLQPGGGVGQLNLLDAGLMPYTAINGATFPAPDPNLIKTSPAPGSPGYDVNVQTWIKSNAPDTFAGLPVKFHTTFANTVGFKEAFPDGKGNAALLPGIDLEMWGIPTSAPAQDPNNKDFVYQRFQRGTMHYDKATGLTQGLLLADYFKSIITGQGIPPDLDAQARGSPFYRQYNNGASNGLNRPDQVPGTSMKDAFEKEGPQTSTPPPGQTPTPGTPPIATSGLRYGIQAHLYYQDQPRVFSMVRGAGFNWVKQQIRWAHVEESRGAIAWGLMDPMVDNAVASGSNLLFSIVTTPSWARSDRNNDGPPDNLNDLGNFVGALASRYKGRVKAYEVWNEQNFSREWGGGQCNNAGSYVELLKVAYARIKAADPGAIVVSGALTPTGVMNPSIAMDDKWYLEQMYLYQNGVFKTVADAVGSHMAGYNNAPEDWVDKNTVNTPGFKGHPSFYFRRIDDLYSVMVKYGDRRQMWITEYHWASTSPPVPAGYEWTTHLSEQQVADFFVRSIQSIKASRPWVGAFFVWNLNWRTFADPRTSETAIFGILNGDWTPRLIYQRLKDMPK